MVRSLAMTRVAPWLVALAVGLTGVQTRAAPRNRRPPPPVPTEPAPAPAEETPLQRAEQLFRRGVARYEIAKYDEAVQLWTEAYEILEPTLDNKAIRNDLVYNIARAQVEAYRIDHDTRRLRQAKQLLERYLEVYRELAGTDEPSAPEVAQAEGRIAEIDAMIREAEQAAEQERAARDNAPAKDAARRQARALVISGAVVTSLGVVGLGVAFAGIGVGVQADRAFEDEPAQRETHRRRGRQANVLVATGTAVGVAFLAAGIALLVIGKRNERRLRADALAGGGTYGLALSGRF
jgi:tetratricopeptide (TPR) repeat protein